MSDDNVHRIEFGGLSIAHDHQVISPRPWTTAPSYWAADLLRQAPPGPVLELCAGVGHIGLLAVAETDRDLVLVDADKTACDFALENAAAARPDGGYDVRHGRVDEVLAADEQFAGVIADPPWVRTEDTDRFPDDPLTAIDGGPDGLQIAWTCLAVAAEHVVDTGWLLLQLGSMVQAGAVQARLAEQPGLRFLHMETRDYGEHGVLVHLARPH